MVDVFLNGKFAGTVEDGGLFTQSVKDLRREGTIAQNINVYYDGEANEVFLLSDEGRARRPLIVVKDGKPLLTEAARINDEKVVAGGNHFHKGNCPLHIASL